eukprot:353751-Chlamydomonas_euryale.AAC.10
MEPHLTPTPALFFARPLRLAVQILSRTSDRQSNPLFVAAAHTIDPRLLVDQRGRTPFDIARRKAHFQLLHMLNPLTSLGALSAAGRAGCGQGKGLARGWQGLSVAQGWRRHDGLWDWRGGAQGGMCGVWRGVWGGGVETWALR